ncbi:ABC transporter permease [Dactylosporangium sp. NPDC051485]|uniref:ABC transporter permease n=1 Tax=Dactylosporangium sp. NPDC051485 TaxID=3154846 RepID=UPI0034234664
MTRALLLVERNLMIYRYTWAMLAAEVLEPVLYLLSIGVGVGALVGSVPGLDDPGITYAQFVAPALLATAAMNGAMNETSFGAFFKLRFERTYDTMVTTPLTVRDIALGETAWALLRGAFASGGFLAIVAVLGYARSPWILLAVPGAAVVGFAFAAAGLAVATFLRNTHDFQLIQLVMLPMFLFATTFFPVSVYPRPVQVFVECLPLYHAIQLLREPALGHVGLALLPSLAYLLAFGALSLVIALPRLRRALLA